ncbi:MAG: hypothetical protein FRX49_04118 [Trebouxia sp. A1-2]|nr:MAG: hypothetical protein FRX49_04118 [Trebouxia sp. A1-2]
MERKMKMKRKTDQVSRLSQAVLQQSLQSEAYSLGQGRIPKGQSFSPQLGIWVAQHDQQGCNLSDLYGRLQIYNSRKTEATTYLSCFIATQRCSAAFLLALASGTPEEALGGVAPSRDSKAGRGKGTAARQ